MNNKINKLEQLSLLSKTLNDNLTPMYDLSNMEVVFKVDRELLTKINEDMFYTCNPASLQFPDETDEIILEINNIKYRYILED
jgi:hypothetical protein